MGTVSAIIGRNIAYGVETNVTKSPRRRPGAMGIYSNLATKRRSKKDAAARKKAEYLASLPKHPFKRLLYRLQPKRVYNYWFSKRGALMAAKLLGVFILLVILGVGAVFAYYRKDLQNLNPDQLAARVQTTVTKYLDRNGTLLWEDTGSGDYRLVIKSGDIPNYMKEATVSIEDKDFYKNNGISVTGITRSLLNNIRGGDVQGGSTLTQQLVKQVFLADQANLRGFNGVPRKIKEIILAIEVDRMYSKDQILTLYLNESPYGGRRNGVESAAQTYFGKDAKDLDLAECALLAAIPNSPSLYDPYTGDHQALLDRQHEVLNDMLKQGYITQAQADAAKAEPILDSIKPLSDQTDNMKAPNFVLQVQQQLEKELGKGVVGQGGLTVTTTLDYGVQQQLESAMTNMFDSSKPKYDGFTDGAGMVEDVQTGQVLALLGSRGYNYPGFGQTDATQSFIQPGSTVKPMVYAQLMQDNGDKQQWGGGSIVPDVKTTFAGGYTPMDWDDKYDGPETIRRALARSRNIPAVYAMEVAGKDATWNTIHALGDTSYCTDGQDAQAGLASAIGGCGVKMTDHVNATASMARMGAYIPQSMVLKVTNSQGTVLKQFTQPTPKQIITNQSAYIIADILADTKVRATLHPGNILPNLNKMGIKMALKTGTSDINSKPKDLWNVAYTPHIAMSVWLGNPDPTPINTDNSAIPAAIVDPVMAYATQEYINQGKAKTTDWFTEPTGIQHINGDLYPSYYKKSQGAIQMTFDKVSKKLATNCTPPGAQIQIAVSSYTDPVTHKKTAVGTGGYDPTSNDDVHNCSDAQPSISLAPSANGSELTVKYASGTFGLQNVVVSINGNAITTLTVSGSGSQTVAVPGSPASYTASAVVTDQAFYTATANATYP